MSHQVRTCMIAPSITVKMNPALHARPSGRTS